MNKTKALGRHNGSDVRQHAVLSYPGQHSVYHYEHRHFRWHRGDNLRIEPNHREATIKALWFLNSELSGCVATRSSTVASAC